MSVRVRARLPKGDANGIAHLEARLAKDPDLVIPCVVLLQADTIEEHPHDTDDARVVKCTILAIETPGDKADAGVVDGLLRQTYSARTGKLALPFEDETGKALGKGMAE